MKLHVCDECLMDHSIFPRDGERMDLNISGRVVSFRADYALIFEIVGGFEIKIECPGEVLGVGREPLSIRPSAPGLEERWKHVFQGRNVHRVLVDKTAGSMSIGLDSGVVLNVPPDDDFEAWVVIWPRGAHLLSLPGGGTAQWDGYQEP